MNKTVFCGVFVSAVAAGFFGAGTAAAAPGISFDPGTGGTETQGFGDQTQTGATAYAEEGNTALAISLFRPSNAAALNGQGNSVVAIDSIASADMADNKVFTAGGSFASVSGTNNNVVTLGGGTTLMGKFTHDNTVVNVGGLTSGNLQGTAKPGVVSVNVCDTVLTGQADYITVTSGSC